MSTNYQQPPPSMPPSMPPAGPPPSGPGGHGAFTEEDIQQIMADTGYSYEEVCAAIDKTGATSKEQLFPNFYTGQGIEPQAPPAEQTVGPGVVQGQPAAQPETTTMPGQGAEIPAAEGEGISPEVAAAMHEMMKPKSPAAKYRRR